MSTIVNTKVGQHRGKLRIWLEGKKLSREGIEPGMKYDLVQEDQKITLRTHKEGRFKVSHRNRQGVIMPIVDLTCEEVRQAFSEASLLRVVIRTGQVVITLHH